MGSICTNNFEKQEGTETIDTYKNSIQLQVKLGSYVSIELILGHYKQHRSQSLFVLTQIKNIQHCDPLKDYTQQCDKVIDAVNNMRKTFYKPTVNTKYCPYKKILLGILQHYKSEEAMEYQQQFRNILRELFISTKQATIEFMNTIEGIHTLPNQMLIAILFEELATLRTPFKVYLITTQKKMMNLYKYELMKTEKCSL